LNASTEGKALKPIEGMHKLTQGELTNKEKTMLENLQRRRSALYDVRQATERATADAVKAFDKTKAGKQRSKLIHKKNGSQKELSVKELAMMKVRLNKRKALEKARDEAVKECTKLKKTLNE